MAAIEPKRAAGRQQVDQRPARQALQAGGPARAAQARGDGVPARRQVAKRQRAGHREPGVVDLMRAGEHRQRQIERAPAALDQQPVGFAARPPVAAMDLQGCADLGGARLDHRQRLGRLRPDDAGHLGLQDARLLERDLRQVLAQKALVIERDRRQRGQPRPRDHVGGIEPAAEPGLDQQQRRPDGGQTPGTPRPS